MMTVSVHVDRETRADVREFPDHEFPFVSVVVTSDAGSFSIVFPYSRIDDARRVARALNNE